MLVWMDRSINQSTESTVERQSVGFDGARKRNGKKNEKKTSKQAKNRMQNSQWPITLHRVMGDSNLVILFYCRKFTPGKQTGGSYGAIVRAIEYHVSTVR